MISKDYYIVRKFLLETHAVLLNFETHAVLLNFLFIKCITVSTK